MSILCSHLHKQLCETAKLRVTLQHVRHIRDYDKVIKLLPKQVEYNHEDDRFLKAPLYDDTYPKYTDEEIYELSRIKLEKDYPDRHWTSVDPNQEPYRQVFVGNDTQNMFTGHQALAEKNVWFWVERLMPKQTLPDDKDSAADLNTRLKPSGFIVQSKSKPKLPYFIPRTRGKLYPVYRKYEIEGRTDGYWKNPWDNLINHWNYREIMKKEIFFELPRVHTEQTRGTLLISTQITQIQGDIWQLEEDLRGDLEAKYQKRILSAIHEVEGTLKLKGDYTTDVVKWVRDKGF